MVAALCGIIYLHHKESITTLRRYDLYTGLALLSTWNSVPLSLCNPSDKSMPDTVLSTIICDRCQWWAMWTIPGLRLHVLTSIFALLRLNPFQGNQVKIITADALAPCVARPSASMILTIGSRDVFVFLESKSQQPAMFLCRGMMSNANTYLWLLKTIAGKHLMKSIPSWSLRCMLLPHWKLLLEWWSAVSVVNTILGPIAM